MNALERAAELFGATVGRAALAIATVASKVLPQRFPQDPPFTVGVDDHTDKLDGLYGVERPDPRTRH